MCICIRISVISSALSPPGGGRKPPPVSTGFSSRARVLRASNHTTPQPPPRRRPPWIPRAAVGGVSPEQVPRLIPGAAPASSLTHPAHSSAPSTPASTWLLDEQPWTCSSVVPVDAEYSMDVMPTHERLKDLLDKWVCLRPSFLNFLYLTSKCYQDPWMLYGRAAALMEILGTFLIMELISCNSWAL